MLESVLPDVTAGTHGDGAVVQTLWWLGDCLGELGEHRAAAERRLQAAEIARHWPEQQDHATLAHLAASSLEQAGLTGEAEQAYARAGELWRTVGDAPGLVRSLRARAWLALRSEAGPDGARALMADAVEECEAAVEAAPDDETRARLTADLGHTHRQFADLLVQMEDAGASDDGETLFEEAVAALDRAIAAFAPLGPDTLQGRCRAELAAAWLEADLGRPADAAARARAVLAALENAPEEDETARSLRGEAEHLLNTVTEKKREPTED